jgi:hypothetical protein
MVGSCRCLKENLDELRIERVCYERVTGKRKELDDFLFADHRLAISIGTDAPVLACEVID